MITQVGYEIDSQGNVGNETRRIEDLQLRFILLMTIINATIEDSESKHKVIKTGSEGMPQRKWNSHVRIDIFD